MTTFNKTTLKTFFEQGDVPTGTNYADFIDSCVNLVETTAQNMAGPLSVTELITPRVSATNITLNGDTTLNGNITGTGVNKTINYQLTATSGALSLISYQVDPSLGTITVQVGVNQVVFDDTNGVSINCDVSVQTNATVRGTVTVNQDCLVSGAVSAKRVHQPIAIISAAGTTQGTAALCSAAYCRLQGVADGSTTGFSLPANRQGWTQFIRNETAASANLWPPTGGQINALGANAAFALAANTMYTVVHFAASAYGVK